MKRKLLDTKKVHLGETFSKIQLDVCVHVCMYVNTSKALEIERQNTVIKRDFSFNLDIEVSFPYPRGQGHFTILMKFSSYFDRG